MSSFTWVTANNHQHNPFLLFILSLSIDLLFSLFLHTLQSAPVVETQAYDILLEGAMRAQRFHSRNLRLNGPWKWLLDAFADYYGVSDSYAKLR
jgi:hypothetical protein